MEKLSREDPDKAEVVKLRYFAGLTMARIAEALGISLATTNRHWSYSSAWLYKELSGRVLSVDCSPVIPELAAVATDDAR